MPADGSPPRDGATEGAARGRRGDGARPAWKRGLLTRRAFVLGGAAVALAALSGWVAWGNGALEATRVAVASARLPRAFDGYRVAHVSDLHNAEFGPDNRDLLDMLRSLGPDLVAVTGDLVDSRRTDFDVAARFVEGAAAVAPVMCVAGNHEARVARRDPTGYAAHERRLAAVGATVLHGGVRTAERDGARIAVLGVDDPSAQTGAEDGFRGVATWDEADIMRRRLAGLAVGVRSGNAVGAGRDGGETTGDGAPFTLLLSHRPELFDVYAEAGVDLVLAGHAHGGQFRLPFVGGVLAPNQGFFPRYDAGLYTGEPSGPSGHATSMVVSRGLGNSLFPFRVNNRPEVVLVELHRQPDEG